MKPAPFTILTLPSPLLRQRAEEVDEAALKRFQKEGFIDALVTTMRKSGGVGIAAIQVGVLSRIIVVLEGRTPRVFVNPAIINRSLRTAVEIEGCLSVPGVVGAVRRAGNITIRACDESFRPLEKKFKDLTARIFQHELDHLDGVLFIDRAIKTAAQSGELNRI